MSVLGKICSIFGIIIGSLTIVSFVLIFTLSTCDVIKILLGARLFNLDGAPSRFSESTSEVVQIVFALAQQLSSPALLQYFTLSNMTMSGLYIVLLVFLIQVDNAMIVVKESIRSKAKLPEDVVINHYNDSTYSTAINTSQCK